MEKPVAHPMGLLYSCPPCKNKSMEWEGGQNIEWRSIWGKVSQEILQVAES
jgi:hypothetical protein